MNLIVETKDVEETITLGEIVGSLLGKGDVVALVGQLGTGKTQFIKGLAKGAGVNSSAYVTSPSFTLVHEYKGKIPFYHLDLYRLSTHEDIGLEEYTYGNGIAAVEWADRIPSLIPPDGLWVRLQYLDEGTRSVEIECKGRIYEELKARLDKAKIPYQER